MKVINLGISSFYDALVSQGVEAAQIDWKPPVKVNVELGEKADKIAASEFGKKMAAANRDAIDMIINADPAWVGVGLAGD